jgi:hypothetical protein
MFQNKISDRVQTIVYRNGFPLRMKNFTSNFCEFILFNFIKKLFIKKNSNKITDSLIVYPTFFKAILYFSIYKLLFISYSTAKYEI